MHQRADRDGPDGERVADADIRLVAAHHAVAHAQPERRNDVAALAIGIQQQGDTSRAVGVILNRFDLRRDVQLVPPEVDQAITALVTAATMTDRDPAHVVATTAPALLSQEGTSRLRARNLLEGMARHVPATGRCWLVLLDWHRLTSNLGVSGDH